MAQVTECAMCPFCRVKALSSQVRTNFALCDAIDMMQQGDRTRGELLPYAQLAAACGHWNAAQVLGTGGAATVYRAELPPFGPVAVKRFQIGAGAAAGRGFQRELDALCQHRHPHILEIIGSSTEGPENLIVMPLMEGGTLTQALPRMLWTLRSAVLGQMVRALAFLHGKKVLHRDVKSSNILLDGSLRHARLADFGLARQQQGQGEKGTTGVIVGSLGYMAPELMMRPASEKADAFALGVVFLEALTGLPAWGPDEEGEAEEGSVEDCLSLMDRVVTDGAFQKRRLEAAACWPEEEAKVVADQAVALTLFDPGQRRGVAALERDEGYIAHLERADTALQANTGLLCTERLRPTTIGKPHA